MSDDFELDASLRTALRDIPTPAVSADFDARVLAGLKRPQPWWQYVWRSAGPLVTGSACSFAAVVLLALWVTQMPVADTVAPVPAAVSLQAQSHLSQGFGNHLPPVDADMADLDKWLERRNLRAASLLMDPELHEATAPKSEGGRVSQPTNDDRKSDPDRPQGVGMAPGLASRAQVTA